MLLRSHSQIEIDGEVDHADVAELADAYGLGPYAARLGGSSPSIRTILLRSIVFTIELRRNASTKP